MEDKEDRRSGWDNLGIWGTSGIHTGRAPVSLRIGDVGNSKDIDISFGEVCALPLLPVVQDPISRRKE